MVLREATLAEIPHRRLEAGDAFDFDRLVWLEQGRIRALAWRFGLPESELDDVVQDILMKAWGARQRFRWDAEHLTWIRRIAVNHLASRRRSLRSRIAESVVVRDRRSKSDPSGIVKLEWLK